MSIVFLNVLVTGNEPIIFIMNIIFLIVSYGLFNMLINKEKNEQLEKINKYIIKKKHNYK